MLPRPRLLILASQLGLHFTCEGRVNVPPGDGLLAWGETLAGAGSDEESPQVAPSEFVPRVRCGFVLRVDISEPTDFGSLGGFVLGFLTESSIEGNNRKSEGKIEKGGKKVDKKKKLKN